MLALLKVDARVNGVKVPAGEVVDLPEEAVNQLIKEGSADAAYLIEEDDGKDTNDKGGDAPNEGSSVTPADDGASAGKGKKASQK